MAQNVVINGVTYQNVPEVDIPKSGGGTAKFYDTSGATGTAAHLLTGDTLYGESGEVQGSMANNGATGGTIATKSGTVAIPEGYTSGGSVSIVASAVADCVASSIVSGKTILGVAGSATLPSISQDSTTKVVTIS